MTGLPWDASYQDGPAPWQIGRPQPAVVRLAEREVFRGEVLDAGCGSGENTLHLAAQGLVVVGVDVAETALAIARTAARERSLDAEFVAADAFALDELGRTFDCVLDCGLFHTCDADERPVYAASLAAATRPGGAAFLLCLADEGTDLGPHPVARSAITQTFVPETGWRLVAIAPERIETRFHVNGAPAWLVTLVRV